MKKAPSIRNRELAQIHIAKQQLGMDDDTYRDMLWTVGRVRSSANLDHAGRRRVLDHMTACGWVNDRPKNEWAFIDTAAKDKQPLLRKICAVCRVMKVGKHYAEGVAKRQHGIERHLEMMSYDELWQVAGCLERTRKFKGAAGE